MPPSNKNESATKGRPLSGKTRSQIEAESTKKYRNNQTKAGLVQIRPFVTTKTKSALVKLKQEFQVNTIGDVIDRLILQKFDTKKKND